MKKQNVSMIVELLQKGVKIPNPKSVEIGEDVLTDRISGKGVTLYSGCKIYGGSTFIHNDSRLGYEGPVTVQNCQIGPNVELKGGFFKESVFLAGASMGSGAHVREGTILEEHANCSHTVGLKQTILFPFVTLGSLINFCDCFMSGGTSRKNHSEVGSSYIHFNYTPNKDKATPSLIGNVPNGVMLNQKQIFLGGQGGLVGPCCLAFGTVIAAGSIYRKDELRPGRLLLESAARGGSIPFAPGLYQTIKRIVVNNIAYIANLSALKQWYMRVRPLFVSDELPKPLLDGLEHNVNIAIAERVSRFKELCLNMPESISMYIGSLDGNPIDLLIRQKQELYENCSELESVFYEFGTVQGDLRLRDSFLENLHSDIHESEEDYITVIKGLLPENAKTGSRWLQGIVDSCFNKALCIIPLFR
jgi:UDP-N-acetylglucosamine/UDP-N-acetylgalactosamine diphosphorylase